MAVATKKDRWVKRWQVPSSDGTKTYTVAVDANGNYGCSCPHWKFRRKTCKHIILVQGGYGEEIAEMSETQQVDAKLKAFALKGYRYYTWRSEPLPSWSKQRIDELKHNKRMFEDVKTFIVHGEHGYDTRIVVVKETEYAYEREFLDFLYLLKRCNFRRHLVRNPFLRPGQLLGLHDQYWITQKELRETLHKRWFSIRQHILFNNGSDINPNLGPAVYNRGKWGKRILRLQKHFKFLR